MNEKILFNEFVSEHCQNDLSYAKKTLEQWLEKINERIEENEEELED